MVEEVFNGEVVRLERDYRPVGTSLIVKLLDQEEETQHPRNVNNGPSITRGEVVSIGDGELDGKIIKCPAEVGDVVIFTHHSGDKINKDLRIIGFRHILAIEC